MKNNRQILLRALEPSDVSILVEWENDPEIWRVSETFEPVSEYKLSTFIKHTLSLDVFALRQMRLMITVVENQNFDDVKTIGAIDFFDFDPINKRGGIGLMIAKEYRQQGLGQESLEQFLLYLENQLQLHQVYANIPEDNEASIKLFENMGFQKCAEKKQWLYRDGKYITEYMYQYFFEK